MVANPVEYTPGGIFKGSSMFNVFDRPLVWLLSLLRMICSKEGVLPEGMVRGG
ncbi:Uncharacterised protein [Dermatophilus congolensis]|uniref:Uncharacterized protein n=1 Tax=Dermatophilus congolensis TaxID=1863 RepID=A0AA46BMQ2_9MICO|nr:Uncharacterised protein [Dermatophilus congolensis]